MNARLGIASAAAVAVVAFAAASHAEDLRLSFTDLDLSRPEQAQVLNQRIDRAAQTWCEGEAPTGSLLSTQSCLATARQQLIASMPVATRTAYMAARESARTASTASPTPTSGS